MPLITQGTLVETSDLYCSKGWTTFKPVITSANSTAGPSLGAGSIQYGRYIHIGNVCDYQFTIRPGTGSTSDGSGKYEVSMPVANSTAAAATVVGASLVYTSTGGYVAGVARVRSTGGATLKFVTDAGGVDVNKPTAGWWGDGAYLGASVRYVTT